LSPALNTRLRATNPIDFPETFRNDTSQLYGVWILRPGDYSSWFRRLRTGLITFDLPGPADLDKGED